MSVNPPLREQQSQTALDHQGDTFPEVTAAEKDSRLVLRAKKGKRESYGFCCHGCVLAMLLSSKNCDVPNPKHKKIK